MAKLKISDYLTVSAAAKILGVNPITLRRWDKAGKLKANRNPITDYRLYLKKDLEKLLAHISTDRRD